MLKIIRVKKLKCNRINCTKRAKYKITSPWGRDNEFCQDHAMKEINYIFINFIFDINSIKNDIEDLRKKLK